jgi:hypothetical protein
MDYDLWIRFLDTKANWLAVNERFGLFRWYPGQKSRDVWIKYGVPEIADLQKNKYLGHALPEDEMIALYEEYFYGTNRLTNMWSFAKRVPLWNAYLAKRKNLLRSKPLDAWVQAHNFQHSAREQGVLSNALKAFKNLLLQP